MTFWAMVLEFRRTVTREEGRLRRQLLRFGRRTSSAWGVDDVDFRDDIVVYEVLLLDLS